MSGNATSRVHEFRGQSFTVLDSELPQAIREARDLYEGIEERFYAQVLKDAPGAPPASSDGK